MIRVYIGHNYTQGQSTYSWTREQVRGVIRRELRRFELDSCTIFDATGYWKGHEEDCTVVEFAYDEAEVERFAKMVQSTLEQECVLIVRSAVTQELVS